MDYAKYLHCHACQQSGLYCKQHRIEVEKSLRKREIKKVLQLRNHKSDQYKHAIKGLLESYDIWKISV